MSYAMHHHEYQGFKNQVRNSVHKSVLNRWQNDKESTVLMLMEKVKVQRKEAI
jgi:hypothetical protein